MVTVPGGSVREEELKVETDAVVALAGAANTTMATLVAASVTAPRADLTKRRKGLTNNIFLE
jgi:hypothetical protein